MKSNIKYTIFGWLWAAALLLATACTDTADLNASAKSSGGDNSVSFIVKAEHSTVSTRVDETPGEGGEGGESDDDTTPLSTSNVIGKGTKINALIFAVYEVKFKKGVDLTNGLDGLTEDDIESRELLTDFQKSKTGDKVDDIEVGTGQNVVKLEDFVTDGYKFQLTTNPDKYYQVAFWAQHSQTKAYDATDLRAVEVKYERYVDENNFVHQSVTNNDETRDAFCAVSKIFKGDIKSAETVTLTRPLAQINIGTTGWDYEGAAVLKPSPIGYTVSQLTISANSLARYYSVFKGKALTDDDLDELVKETRKEGGYGNAIYNKDVVFEYGRIPAYNNINQNLYDDITTYLRVDGEEFLRVDINGDNKIAGYVSWDEYSAYRKENPDAFNQGYMPHTETFKYLSMIYVLVPEGHPFTADDKVGNKLPNNEAAGSVIGSIKFETKGYEIKDKNTTGGDGTETPAGADAEGADTDTGKGKELVGLGEIFTIKNVPVQKNWRTNILGSNFFVVNNVFKVYVVPEYCGDYNNWDGEAAPEDGDGSGGWLDDVKFDKGDNKEWKIERGGKPNDDFPDENPKYNDDKGDPDPKGDMDKYYPEEEDDAKKTE